MTNDINTLKKQLCDFERRLKALEAAVDRHRIEVHGYARRALVTHLAGLAAALEETPPTPTGEARGTST